LAHIYNHKLLHGTKMKKVKINSALVFIYLLHDGQSAKEEDSICKSATGVLRDAAPRLYQDVL